MTEKKTGLGNSLLLKRTSPRNAPSPHVSERLDAQTSEASRRLDARKNQRGGKRPAKPLRDKCTIYLESDVNERLEIVARMERKERSEVVTEILRRHLPKYRVDVEN
jgi:hypothetical protein